jgi:hypothetical protein
MEQPIQYCAYLIRLWPTKRQGVTGCRVSLQSVDGGHRRNFADLESLYAFLQSQTEEKDQAPETADP